MHRCPVKISDVPRHKPLTGTCIQGGQRQKWGAAASLSCGCSPVSFTARPPQASTVPGQSPFSQHELPSFPLYLCWFTSSRPDDSPSPRLQVEVLPALKHSPCTTWFSQRCSPRSICNNLVGFGSHRSRLHESPWFSAPGSPTCSVSALLLHIWGGRMSPSKAL